MFNGFILNELKKAPIFEWNMFQSDTKLQEPEESPLTRCFSETLFLGAAGEVSFDDFTAGVISSTDTTSILLHV